MSLFKEKERWTHNWSINRNNINTSKKQFSKWREGHSWGKFQGFGEQRSSKPPYIDSGSAWLTNSLISVGSDHWKWKIWAVYSKYEVKGSSTKKILAPKSHIVDSNGLWWYSSFRSEGPKNHFNFKIVVSKPVAWDLEGRQHFYCFLHFFRKVVKKQIFYCQADWWFLGPSYQNEVYHAPLLYKIWDLGERIFLV